MYTANGICSPVTQHLDNWRQQEAHVAHHQHKLFLFLFLYIHEVNLTYAHTNTHTHKQMVQFLFQSAVTSRLWKTNTSCPSNRTLDTLFLYMPVLSYKHKKSRLRRAHVFILQVVSEWYGWSHFRGTPSQSTVTSSQLVGHWSALVSLLGDRDSYKCCQLPAQGTVGRGCLEHLVVAWIWHPFLPVGTCALKPDIIRRDYTISVPDYWWQSKPNSVREPASTSEVPKSRLPEPVSSLGSQ